MNSKALKLEMESLERKKIKAEDLADLKDKTDEELRDIIERQRFTTRDLNDQLSDIGKSREKREKELEDQIVGLNNIIKEMKAKKLDAAPPKKRSSVLEKVQKINDRSEGKEPIQAKKPAKIGNIAASLASKLPFGNKPKKVENDKKNNIAAACTYVCFAFDSNGCLYVRVFSFSECVISKEK